MQHFNNPIANGFVRVAAASIPLEVGNPLNNAERVIEVASKASDQGAGLVVFQELTLTGVSAGDLVTQNIVLEHCETAINLLVQASRNWSCAVVFGSPIQVSNRLVNAAILVARGKLRGVWAKDPDAFDARWFTPVSASTTALYRGFEVYHPSEATFEIDDVPGLKVAVQFDGHYLNPRALDASVVVHLSGEPALAGNARTSLSLARELSRLNHVAIIKTRPAAGESTNDHAWDGLAFVVEDGQILSQNERFSAQAQLAFADVDLASLRARQTRLNDSNASAHTSVSFSVQPHVAWPVERPISRFPFVEMSEDTWDADLEDTFNLQVQALVRRLEATGHPHPVIGVSGGLDSTHALLVCIEAMRRTGRPASDILTFTMPGFATSDHTKNNAIDLSEALGTTFEQIDIRDTARQMLKDMGHPFGRGEEVYDVTFENVQAGLRTDFLFRIANGRRGLVIGTGDYSELMLGWCTFGVGDHMSHYSVNPGVPKTLMQHLIRWIIRTNRYGQGVSNTLESILNTEITPELIPTRPGKQAQSTQSSIGPYELQDFNAYYLIFLGLGPEQTAFRANLAFGEGSSQGESDKSYTLFELLKWQRVFLKRFFVNQFKRSTLPNGPRVIEGASLSPRGGLMLGSDVPSTPWIERLDKLAQDLGIDLESR